MILCSKTQFIFYSHIRHLFNPHTNMNNNVTTIHRTRPSYRTRTQMRNCPSSSRLDTPSVGGTTISHHPSQDFASLPWGHYQGGLQVQWVEAQASDHACQGSCHQGAVERGHPLCGYHPWDSEMGRVVLKTQSSLLCELRLSSQKVCTPQYRST